MTLSARLHDGAGLGIEVAGEGPTILVPVNPVPAEGPQADELRRWGVDPALGRRIIDGLAEVARVVAFDYEGHVLAVPKPDTLTPENIVADLLAVADAAGAARFAYYGYSWLGLAGLQLAVRSPRLTALAMGGFPPLDGPYREMLEVTRATHRLAVEAAEAPPTGTAAGSWTGGGGDEIDWSTVSVTLRPDQTRQFVTLYEALQGFDDRAAQASIGCPRLCFVGGADEIEYDARWGDVRVSMAEGVARRRAELERLGWTVRILEGLDHTQAMQPDAALGVVRPWLADVLAGVEAGGSG